MDIICNYLLCGCCGSEDPKQQTRTQKKKNLQTLDRITPDSKKSKIWSAKTPLDVRTEEMTDFYRIPEQVRSEIEILQTLGYQKMSYIDRGSYGSVYEAKHIHSGLKIAIKKNRYSRRPSTERCKRKGSHF